MRAIVLRGLAERKLRSALTALAIVLGVAMISGTYVLTNQISGAFEEIFLQSNKGIDTVVTPKQAFKDTTGLSSTLELNQSLVRRVAAVPGVATAGGEREDEGVLVVNGKPIKPVAGAPAFVISYSPPPLSGATTFVKGRAPQAIGEVAVDKSVADDESITVGQHVQVATATGLKNAVVTGICNFPANTGGSVFVVDTLQASQLWYGKAGKVTRITAAGRPGISEQVLTRRIAAALRGQPVTVKSGTQDAKDNAKDINDAINKILGPALGTFGMIAILVGAFIIRNTFTITVTQRLREFALLRGIGATAGQIRMAVVAEALTVGTIASVLGLLGGFAVAAGMGALFDAVGFGLPTNSPSLTGKAVAWSLAIGISVTVFSALAPARRAMRIPPVAAMQEGATLPPGRMSRYTWLFSLLIALLGAFLIFTGFSSKDVPANNRLITLAMGALLVFIAVAMGAKYLVGPLARAVGWPLERIAGITGSIARENATRNPSRTAITSAALMIGVAVVVFVGTLAEGLKTSLRDAVRGSVRADVVVTSTTFGRMPANVVRVVRETNGIKLAAPIYAEDARDQHKKRMVVAGVDPRALSQVLKLDWKKGTAAAFSGLGAHDAVVDDQHAAARGWKLGSVVNVRTRAGRSHRFVIRGIFDSEHGSIGGFFVSMPAFRTLFTDLRPLEIFAKASGGLSADAAAARVDSALKTQYPLADTLSTAKWVKRMEDQVNTLVYLLYALLSMSVLISLFGIVNTLVLSIFERTREIGMLRAVGETRWQVRWMIADESVITAIIGTVLGIAVGLFFGFVISEGLRDQGVTFAVPVGQLVAIVLLAVVAGVAAAVIPARRAARLDPVQALQYE